MAGIPAGNSRTFLDILEGTSSINGTFSYIFQLETFDYQWVQGLTHTQMRHVMRKRAHRGSGIGWNS